MIVAGVQKVQPGAVVQAVEAQTAVAAATPSPPARQQPAAATAPRPSAARRLAGEIGEDAAMAKFFIDRPIFAIVIAHPDDARGRLVDPLDADRAVSDDRAAVDPDHRDLSRAPRRRRSRTPSCR